MSTIHDIQAAKFLIHAAIPRSKSMSFWPAAQLAGRRFPRARAPASMKRSNCGTATKNATWAKAFPKRSRTSPIKIRPALEGVDALDQLTVDGIMLALDGTETKSKLARMRSWQSRWRMPRPPPRRSDSRCSNTWAAPMPKCCRFPWPT